MSRNRRSQYSIPINEEKLKFLEEKDDAKINWEQFYANAAECQSQHNDYFGKATMDLDAVIKLTEKYAPCTFNLPVFLVKPLKTGYRGVDAAQCSPCYCRMKKHPNDPQMAGENWLPEKLDKWFDDANYSSELAPAERSGFLGINGTNSTEGSDLVE